MRYQRLFSHKLQIFILCLVLLSNPSISLWSVNIYIFLCNHHLLVLSSSYVILVLIPIKFYSIRHISFQWGRWYINLFRFTISWFLIHNQFLLIFKSEFILILITKPYQIPSQVIFHKIDLSLNIWKFPVITYGITSTYSS